MSYNFIIFKLTKDKSLGIINCMGERDVFVDVVYQYLFKKQSIPVQPPSERSEFIFKPKRYTNHDTPYKSRSQSTRKINLHPNVVRLDIEKVRHNTITRRRLW